MTDHVLELAVLGFAYFVRGIAGFGSGLIAVPILAHWNPLVVVVPVVMTLDFIASFILGGVGARGAVWREIRILVPFGLIGALLGAYALIRLPSVPLLVGLATFAIFFGVRSLLGLQSTRRISRLWAVPAGLLGSGAGAVFGTSAPPYVVYLTHRLENKSQVRATFSWLFVIDGGVRLILFAWAGLFADRLTQTLFALGAIPMVLGLLAGNRVHIQASPAMMQRIIGAILVVSGASLITKVIA